MDTRRMKVDTRTDDEFVAEVNAREVRCGCGGRRYAASSFCFRCRACVDCCCCPTFVPVSERNNDRYKDVP